MEYFQSIVSDYLRADRSTFINNEFLIQLDEGDRPIKGRHWYCDVVAVNLAQSAVYLCEVTYSATQQALMARLAGWAENWAELVHAVRRDTGAPAQWQVQPWVFIPKKYHDAYTERFARVRAPEHTLPAMPVPRVTLLEDTLPWEYCTWDRREDALTNDD